MELVKKWNLVRKTFAILVAVIILILFSIYLFSQTRLAGDVASHLLLAVSPILKIGVPYKDFWEIKPPVWPLVLYLWSNLFGFSILSIRIINIIIAAFTILTSYLIYKKVFQTPVLEIIFISTVIIVLSPVLNSIMMPTELLGLLISMGALLALVSFRKDFPKFYLSGFLFFAASQTKEPFTFTVLTVLPVFIYALLKSGWRRLFKNLTQFLLGVLTCFVIIYIYLAAFGSVEAYVEVFRFKQVFFPFKLDRLSQNFLPGFYAAERTFTEFSSGFSILIVFVALSFYLVNKFKKTLSFNIKSSYLTIKPIIVSNPEKLTKYTVLFYAIGSFLGFGLGGTFGSHYLIQVVIPFYIIDGFLISYLFGGVSFLFHESKTYFYLNLILFMLSIFVLIPKRPYFSYYLRENLGFHFSDNILGFEKRITELTTKDQCVLSVYGWGVSENYLYSGRRPCTRFFLANIVSQDWQKKEYARDVIENPPAVIIYQTGAADMDIQKFESKVINISKIVQNCYIQDAKEGTVYIPKLKNVEDLKSCVKNNSI